VNVSPSAMPTTFTVWALITLLKINSRTKITLIEGVIMKGLLKARVE
jgi:hypothetical protein